VQIKDRGQIQLAALADHELRGIAHPALIPRRRPELPGQQMAATGLAWS
jgi:hypothetical protein